jgi:hypothetical protein
MKRYLGDLLPFDRSFPTDKGRAKESPRSLTIETCKALFSILFGNDTPIVMVPLLGLLLVIIMLPGMPVVSQWLIEMLGLLLLVLPLMGILFYWYCSGNRLLKCWFL